jgi:hypothetical protein
MKMTRLAKIAAAFVWIWAIAVTGTGAFASPNERSTDRYVYVFVTGSLIPQKVKVKSIGTNTVSPMRNYDRDEIDKTGRFTTRDVLALDPSVHVRGR